MQNGLLKLHGFANAIAFMLWSRANPWRLPKAVMKDAMGFSPWSFTRKKAWLKNAKHGAGSTSHAIWK